MFRALFRRSRPALPANTPHAAVPPGVVAWAVGDIHGRSDLLAPLIAAVCADLEASPASRRLFIGLGDYVDKGPDSRGVLDLLTALQARAGIECRVLRGNHEAFFERFLHEPGVGPGWCDYGGLTALASYGVAPPAFRSDADGWAQASADLGRALPDAHRLFLRNLEPSFACGDYFFAHAGARPGVPLDQQTQDDLMWIRDDFTRSNAAFERIVVHGHTPTPALHMDHRRIGLDTGAYATGVLTAMRFEGGTRRLAQVRKAAGRIVIEHPDLADV